MRATLATRRPPAGITRRATRAAHDFVALQIHQVRCVRIGRRSTCLHTALHRERARPGVSGRRAATVAAGRQPRHAPVPARVQRDRRPGADRASQSVARLRRPGGWRMAPPRRRRHCPVRPPARGAIALGIRIMRGLRRVQTVNRQDTKAPRKPGSGGIGQQGGRVPGIMALAPWRFIRPPKPHLPATCWDVIGPDAVRLPRKCQMRSPCPPPAGAGRPEISLVMWPPSPYLSHTALFSVGLCAFCSGNVASGAPKL